MEKPRSPLWTHFDSYNGKKVSIGIGMNSWMGVLEYNDELGYLDISYNEETTSFRADRIDWIKLMRSHGD